MRLKFAVLLLGGWIATCASSSAQGSLSVSTATGYKPRITIGGVNATPDDNIWVQILVAGATSLTGNHTFQLTLTGENAGLFSKGTLIIGGKPSHSIVDITIRAWDKDFAETYDTAPDFARASATPFQVELDPCVDSACSLPTRLDPGFTGLNIQGIPEPGTPTLAAIGLLGLIYIHAMKTGLSVRLGNQIPANTTSYQLARRFAWVEPSFSLSRAPAASPNPSPSVSARTRSRA